MVCSQTLALDFNLSTAAIVYDRTQKVIDASQKGIDVTEEYFIIAMSVIGAVLAFMAAGYCITIICQSREITNLRYVCVQGGAGGWNL